jgi:bacteriocin-like protein
MSDETEVVEVVELTDEQLAEVTGGVLPDPFILGHN